MTATNPIAAPGAHAIDVAGIVEAVLGNELWAEHWLHTGQEEGHQGEGDVAAVFLAASRFGRARTVAYAAGDRRALHLARARAEKLDQNDRLHEWMDTRTRP